jgi:hypothetical protein
MESVSLTVLTVKRDRMIEAIRLLESKSFPRGELAVKQLVARLRLKIEWLDKRIEFESRKRPDNAA